MATDGVSEAADSTFPAVDVDRELNPGKNKDFKVDPISSEVATSLEIKVGFGTLAPLLLLINNGFFDNPFH